MIYDDYDDELFDAASVLSAEESEDFPADADALMSAEEDINVPGINGY